MCFHLKQDGGMAFNIHRDLIETFFSVRDLKVKTIPPERSPPLHQQPHLQRRGGGWFKIRNQAANDVAIVGVGGT